MQFSYASSLRHSYQHVCMGIFFHRHLASTFSVIFYLRTSTFSVIVAVVNLGSLLLWDASSSDQQIEHSNCRPSLCRVRSSIPLRHNELSFCPPSLKTLWSGVCHQTSFSVVRNACRFSFSSVLRQSLLHCARLRRCQTLRASISQQQSSVFVRLT